MSEKTEQPTAHRLREARKKGQLPRSKLFSSSAVTLGGLFGALAFAPESAARFRSWTASMFSRQSLDLRGVAVESLAMLARISLPALAGAFVAAFVVSTAVAGFQFNATAVVPKFDKLNPAEGIKKLFSVRQLVDLAKAMAVIAIVGVLVWKAAVAGASQVFRAVALDGGSAFDVVFGELAPVLKRAACLVLALGAGDWMLAKKRFIKDQMMTREEVKQEHKNQEGDPHHKGKRKQLHKQLAMGGPARGVQKATVVVVNPTHIAVALRYDERECDAPYIVAKGREEDAFQMRREAKEHEVPVVKDIPLARSLIHYDVGEEVPEELYQAAAAVLKVALEATEAEAKDPHPRGGR